MADNLKIALNKITRRELGDEELLEAKTNLFGFLELLMQIDAETKNRKEEIHND